MPEFNQMLFTAIIQNAGASFLIEKADGSVAPLSVGAKGTVIQPQEAIKNMLFGNAADKDQLTKQLVVTLGGQLRSGSRGGAKRGRKPKSA